MMFKRARVPAVLAAGILMLSVAATAQPTDRLLGTWRLDVSKSKYSPGPIPKSTTSIYEAAGKGFKVTVTTEPASGPLQQWSYTSNVDGKDAPVTGNNPNADMAAVRRIDANTLEVIHKKAGKVTTRQRNVIAPDGKTRTVTTTGTDAQGQKVNNVAVYVKQ